MFAEPLVILAPGRCYSSVVTAMLGQHPQMFGLLETQLFARDRMEDWFEDFGTNIHSHGLCRSIAEIAWGEQSPRAVKEARRWLWQRRGSSTADVFRELAEQIYPLVAVEKSPMLSYRPEHMERVYREFPRARFLHLVRSPLGYGKSLLEFFDQRGPRHPRQAAALLRNPESIFYGMLDETTDPPSLDPQNAWYLRHTDVLKFLREVPEEQYMRIRGEDILTDPRMALRGVASWLRLRTDSEAIESMLHPELSPFACLGPWNARFGGDPNFLRDPMLRPFQPDVSDIDAPVPWREDGAGLHDRVRTLAGEFGYSQAQNAC